MFRSFGLYLLLAGGTVLLAHDKLLFAADAEQSPAKMAAAKNGGPPPTIEHALAEKVTLQFIDTPLAEVVEYLDDQFGVPVRLDKAKLKERGIDPSSEAAGITLSTKNISLRAALNLICESLDEGVAWTVKNEAITFTTRDAADSNLVVKVYNVRDLVVFEENNNLSDFEGAIQVITSTISPTTWDVVGGPGSIASCDLNGIHALVISQTPEIHGEVESLLAELRNLKAKPSP